MSAGSPEPMGSPSSRPVHRVAGGAVGSDEKLTCGGPASRIDSGISKNSAGWKWNMPAMTIDGNACSRVLKSRTFAL